jgi:hypothetical protein
MRAILTFKDATGAPRTNLVVMVYTYIANGSDFCGSLLGQATEIPTKGQYYISLTDDSLVTVKVNGVREDGMTGILLNGLYVNGSRIHPATVGLDKFTQAALDYIGSGGSINNNPDNVTIDVNGSSQLKIHDTYLDIIDGDGVSSNPIIKTGLWNHIKHNGVINVKDFGAVGDGVTDDTTAIQTAVNYFVSNEGELFFPKGDYIITGTILASFTGNHTKMKKIYGSSANLLSNIQSAVPMFVIRQRDGSLRNILIDGLMFDSFDRDDGNTLETAFLQIDGGNEHGTVPEYIHAISITNCRFEHSNNHSLWFLGSVFEGYISNIWMGSGNTQGYGIYKDHDTPGDYGNPGGFYLFGVLIEGHKIGLFSSGTGFTMFGCYFWQSAEYGCYILTPNVATFINCHFENNWMSAGSLALGGPGLFLNGRATLVGVEGVTNFYQRYVVEISDDGGETNIIGGVKLGDTVKYAKISGSGSYHFVGIQDFYVSYGAPKITRSANGRFAVEDANQPSGGRLDNLGTYEAGLHFSRYLGGVNDNANFIFRQNGQYLELASGAWGTAFLSSASLTSILMKFNSGATPQIGFFGTTPAGQQTVTGSRGGNAALASLLTALATLGLIIDSSTA